jgi:hypothetical protein
LSRPKKSLHFLVNNPKTNLHNFFNPKYHLHFFVAEIKQKRALHPEASGLSEHNNFASNVQTLWLQLLGEN